MGSQKDFLRFLLKNPATPGTINIIEGILSGGMTFFANKQLAVTRSWDVATGVKTNCLWDND